jgi:predicted TPR repeat methyltransferase
MADLDATAHNLYQSDLSVDPAENKARYDKDATTYEEAVLSGGFGVLMDMVKKVLNDNAAIPDTGVVLDAGCGSGLFPKTYGALPSGATLNGFDISEGMLALCSTLGCYKDLTTANLYEDLPYPDAQIDTIVCNAVLGYIDSTKPLTEFARILKPGGYVFFTFREEHFDRYGYPAALASPDCQLKKIHHSLINPLPNDPKYGKLMVVCLYQKIA